MVNEKVWAEAAAANTAKLAKDFILSVVKKSGLKKSLRSCVLRWLPTRYPVD